MLVLADQYTTKVYAEFQTRVIQFSAFHGPQLRCVGFYRVSSNNVSNKGAMVYLARRSRRAASWH